MNAAAAITILGSTGSIGQNALDVIARHPDRYRVVALTANTGVDVLEQQCLHWRPEFAVMNDLDSAQQRLRRRLGFFDLVREEGRREKIRQMPRTSRRSCAGLPKPVVSDRPTS